VVNSCVACGNLLAHEAEPGQIVPSLQQQVLVQYPDGEQRWKRICVIRKFGGGNSPNYNCVKKLGRRGFAVIRFGNLIGVNSPQPRPRRARWSGYGYRAFNAFEFYTA